MKKLSNLVKQHLQALWKDESGQGAVEYILLLAVVVAIAVMFRTQITKAVSKKLGEIGRAHV